MRVLCTNDDGVGSKGLQLVAREASEAGHDVLVVAPDRDQSGSGAALGRLGPDRSVQVTAVELEHAPGVTAFAVPGPPSLGVISACLGAFGPAPDIVLSGVNAGRNVGHSILHSGTVCAALTAQNFGVRGLAVSLASGDEWHWETACRVACDLFGWVTELPAGTVVNLNVPGVPVEEVKGVRAARLDRFGTFRVAAHAGEGGVQVKFADAEPPDDPNCDTSLLAQGYATITTIRGVCEMDIDTACLPRGLGQLASSTAPAPERAPTKLPGAAGDRSPGPLRVPVGR